MRARLTLLALAALFGGAANDYGPDPADGASHFVGTGAFGDYLTGRSALQHADLQVAADRLEAALTLEPGLPELANQAFVAAVLAAKPDAVRMAASLPDNPVARLVLANREAKSGNWRAAEGAFDGLPLNGLTQALRPLLVAWAQHGDGRPGAALATLQDAIQGGRNRPVLILHAALIADLAGRREDAERSYAAARVEYGGLNLRLGQILASWQARGGDAPGTERLVADMVADNGEMSMARQSLVAEAASPAVRNATDGLAEVYLAMAATLRQQNGIDSANVLLRLALDLRPGFTAARLLLSDIQEAAKQPEAALGTLADVPDTDALAPIVQVRRAGLMDALDQVEPAVASLEALAAQHPDRPEPLALAGDIFRRRSRFAEAAAVYDRAIARLGIPTRANWPIFYERGIAKERSGQWEQAEADFKYALELSPNQPGVLNYLGYAWAEQGRNLDQAQSMIEQAVAQRPEEGSFIDSLGWVLLLRGDKAGALRHLQRAVELMPEDGTINGHLGDALAAAGRHREAEFQWRRALTLNPEPADAARIEAKLGALSTAGVSSAAPPAQ